MRSTIEWGKLHPNGLRLPTRWSPEALEDAYKRCGTITADYAKTFYLVRLHLSLTVLHSRLLCCMRKSTGLGLGNMRQCGLNAWQNRVVPNTPETRDWTVGHEAHDPNKG